MGSLLRTAGLQYIGIIFCVKKFNILTVSPNRVSIFIVRLVTILIASTPLRIGSSSEDYTAAGRCGRF
jgi:hypothetical protein